MDITSKKLTANFPYPNLECTVNFICDAGGPISSNIVVVSNDLRNSWQTPSNFGYTNTWIVSSLAISDVDIWSGESITHDVSKLFSMTGCPSS